MFYLEPRNLRLFSIDEIPLTASSHEKLLGVTIETELKFENHITELCLKYLCRILSSMSLEKQRTLMKAFIESQCNHYPLI